MLEQGKLVKKVANKLRQDGRILLMEEYEMF